MSKLLASGLGLVLRAVLLMTLAWVQLPAPHTLAQSDSTQINGKTVGGKFLRYWTEHGATSLQGMPISEEMQERSDIDGKLYTVQYFEQAVFELHPEKTAPYDVLLALAGVTRYAQKYPNGAPGQSPRTSSGSLLFPETGKRMGCEFRDYWERNGRLMQFGFPISDEFVEVSELDGKPHKVQYFERAVFELYPEINEVANRVRPLQIGTSYLRAKHASLAPPAVTPTAGGLVCTPTLHGPSLTAPNDLPNPPVRSSVGKGHVLMGLVKSSRDCSLIAGAKIIFWLAGPDGQYDDAHTATVVSDGSGAYKFESNYPGFYTEDLEPHIHLFASAVGYDSIETEYFPTCDETEGVFDLVLFPRG